MLYAIFFNAFPVITYYVRLYNQNYYDVITHGLNAIIYKNDNILLTYFFQ